MENENLEKEDQSKADQPEAGIILSDELIAEDLDSEPSLDELLV